MENIYKEKADVNQINTEDSSGHGENKTEQCEKVCKICHSSGEDESPFAHPCKCKGSLKYIHIECLNEWIKLTNTKKCDICNYPFIFQKKFKIDTPKNLPIRYILLFIFKTIWTGVFNLLCFFFFMTKFLTVVCFNGIFFELFFHFPRNMSFKFLFNSMYIIINVLHFVYIRKIFSSVSTLRSRIQTSNVLNALINEVSLRSESTTVTNVGDIHSDTDDSGEQEAEITQMIEINPLEMFFRAPTLQGSIDDLGKMLLMCIISIVYPFIYYVSEYIRVAVTPFFVNSNLKPVNLVSFLEKTSSTSVIWRITGSFVFFSFILLVLNYLKSNTTLQWARNIFYLVKCYSITLLSSFSMTFIIGVLSHFIFSASFNQNNPICTFKYPISSVAVHYMLGAIFLYLFKHFEDKLRKSFRIGLIPNVLKDESISSIVERSRDLSISEYLMSIMSKFVIMLGIPFVMFYLSRIQIDFEFKFEDKVWLFVLLKTFLMLQRNSKNISGVFSKIVDCVVKILSKIFDADNYLYNKEIPVPNKKLLVWALNKKHCSRDYLYFIDEINKTVKKDRSTENEQNENASTFINNNESINESFNITRRPISKVSPSLINSVTENEENKLFEKYKITEKRIKKYYGKTHGRKISIFYRPRFFGIMKILCFIFSLVLSCMIFNLSYRFSTVLCKILNLKKNETNAVFFVYFSSLFIVLISNIPFISNASRNQITKYAVNSLIFSAYTNVIFPFVGSVAYVIINASVNSFKQFSNAFIFLNSLSCLTSSLFETFFIFSRLDSYSSLYFLKQIGSFMVLKLALFFCFLAYTKVIIFTSMYIPIFFTGIVILQIIKITRVLFSGRLMENIRDHFFLDEVDVVNYDHSEDKEVAVQ